MALGQVAGNLELGLSSAAIESVKMQEAQFRQDLADVSQYEIGMQQQKSDENLMAFQSIIAIAMASPLKIAPIA